MTLDLDSAHWNALAGELIDVMGGDPDFTTKLQSHFLHLLKFDIHFCLARRRKLILGANDTIKSFIRDLESNVNIIYAIQSFVLACISCMMYSRYN